MTTNERRAQRSAGQFRSDHKLGAAPIKDVFELVHTSCGVDVMSVEADETEHGLTMVDPETGRTVIAVATTSHPMRLRSSVAHELGHIVAGDLDHEVVLKPGERSDEEIRADAFARHLLLPLSAVTRRLATQTVTMQDLSDLVQEYEVSPHIAAIQLREAGLIDPSLCTDWGRLATPSLAARFGWLSQYKALVADSRTPRAPQSLMSRAVEGFRQGLVDIHEIARWYGQDPEALRAELGDVVQPEDDEDWGLENPLFSDPGGASDS